jgi:hypothetical protein
MVVVAFFGVGIATIVVEIVAPRIDLQRLIIVRNRLIVIAFVKIGVAAVLEQRSATHAFSQPRRSQVYGFTRAAGPIRNNQIPRAARRIK